MRLLRVGRRLPWVAALAAVYVIMVSCGDGKQYSQEEFAAVQRDLQTAQSQLESVEAEKRDLEAAALGRRFEDVGTLLSIRQIMAFPPTIVELNPDSAAIQMITKVPTTCSIIHGLTADYGEISTDDAMAPGGHTDHYHVLKELKPDTVYHYKWGLIGPNGTLYGSEDLTFTTPPASGTSRP